MSKEILSLSRLTGKTSEELEAILYEDGGLKNDWDSEFVDLVLTRHRVQKEDQFKRGEKKKAKEVEGAAKALFDKWGIEADRVEDGLQQLAEKLEAEPPKGSEGDLTPETIRNHAAYKTAVQQDLEKLTKANNELKAKAAKAEADKDAFIQEQQKAAHVNTLSSLARKELKALEASFGADEDKALKAFFALYPPDRFRVEGEAPVPLDENGQPATDEYGDPLPFTEYLRKNWLFGFQSNQPKTPAPPTKGAAGATKTFANEDAYNQAREAAAAAGDWGKVATLEKQYIKELNS
jgi:hypothetical protein